MDAASSRGLPETPGLVETSRRCVLASQKLTSVRFGETHFVRFQVAFWLATKLFVNDMACCCFQVASGGNSLPGLNRLCGSSCFLMARISSISTGLRTLGSQWFFTWPMPCSAAIVPWQARVCW